MVRKNRPARRFVSELVRFEEPAPADWGSSPDGPLFQLAARLRLAEQALDTAMSELAGAEQRLSRTEKGSSRRKPPSWFGAAEAKEQAAGDALELIYQQIARTPAHTKAGLAIKLQLTATLYGENLDEDKGGIDMVSQLLQSLIADTSGQR